MERVDHLTVGLVCSGSGVWFALYWFFFVFFDKQICIAVLGYGVWFAFALYRLYLVFSANDVTVD